MAVEPKRRHRVRAGRSDVSVIIPTRESGYSGSGEWSIREDMARIDHAHPDGPRRARNVVPLLYAAAVLAVFVGTVAVIAVKAGTSSAIVTGVVTVTLAGTAFGLWGASMAVRESGHPAPSLEDVQHEDERAQEGASVGGPS